MRLLQCRLGKAQPPFILVLLLVLAITARVSAVPADAAATTDATTDAAQTTDDPSTTDSTPSVTTTSTSDSSSSSSTSTSESTTSTTSSTSITSTTMDSTTTTSSSTSSSSSSTSSDSTPTTTSASSSSTSTAAPIVTVPPTANAPYMQTTNTPEGTVFIAVGAILGLIGLAVLAWRGMVAWSVNRSVRRAALAQTSDKKRLSRRGGGRKRSHGVRSAPANDVSLDKLGAATRASYKPAKRVPSSNSGLFFSPTAGGAGSHHSLNNAGNRGSSYLPAGYYATAGTSTPVREASGSQPNLFSPTAGLSSPTAFPSGSPSLPAVGSYHDAPHPRHSHVGASTSSLNLSQAPQGRAPSAYLEDLFESHTSPGHSDSGRR
ncbi:uncharacterized protein N7482_005450 [Penicillium canariense]|uniref:Uncharacterized protein n=1 Tax=Penicillium canariense TaxID=189055 RepID=A0A9W9I4V5_9EURO|nr:uncharacterized protein N7482_005450 [Penicillium canariense]KAJ5166669.1 hypothetical protein N7482_005450 [Penicillium canariense]